MQVVSWFHYINNPFVLGDFDYAVQGNDEFSIQIHSSLETLELIVHLHKWYEDLHIQQRQRTFQFAVREEF